MAVPSTATPEMTIASAKLIGTLSEAAASQTSVPSRSQAMAVSNAAAPTVERRFADPTPVANSASRSAASATNSAARLSRRRSARARPNAPERRAQRRTGPRGRPRLPDAATIPISTIQRGAPASHAAGSMRSASTAMSIARSRTTEPSAAAPATSSRRATRSALVGSPSRAGRTAFPRYPTRSGASVRRAGMAGVVPAREEEAPAPRPDRRLGREDDEYRDERAQLGPAESTPRPRPRRRHGDTPRPTRR